MKEDLNILMIEDSSADADLISRELRKGGLSFQVCRVETRGDFLRELRQHPPDLIISDHGLPSFDGFTALALAREKCPETPFIFVTGALGQEVTINAFESGATDYVLKDRLADLVPAVRRALTDVEERAERKLMEAERERAIEELQAAPAKVRTIPGLLPICSSCKKIRDAKGNWQTLEAYFHEYFGASFTHGLCPDCVPKFFPGYTRPNH